MSEPDDTSASGSRTRALIELGLVLGLLAVDFWVLRLWEGWTASLAAEATVLLVVVLSVWRRRPARTDRVATWAKACTEAGVSLAVMAVVLLLATALVRESYEGLRWGFLGLSTLARTAWVARELVEAGAHLLLLLLFLWPLTRDVVGKDRAALAVTAAVFGVFHLPSLYLAIGTAILAVAWVGLFRRSKRLAPLLVAHAILAIVAAAAVPGRLTYDMRVGASALEVRPGYRLLERSDSRELLRAVTSSAYRERHGGRDRGVVEGLYPDLLGRRAIAEEVEQWVGVLEWASIRAVAEYFLSSEEALSRGTWRRRTPDLAPMSPGADIAFNSRSAGFEGWHVQESDWRWSEAEAAIEFRLELEAQRTYVLALEAGAFGPQTVDFGLNEVSLGTAELEEFSSRTLGWVIDSADLRAESANRFELSAPGASLASEEDPRILAVALRSLRVVPLRFPTTLTFTEDEYFLTGFWSAETAFRWTVGTSACLVYPLASVDDESDYILEMRAGGLGEQEVEVLVNGQSVGSLAFSGLTPVVQHLRLASSALRVGPNEVEILVPGARTPEGDTRDLGLAFLSLEISPSG